MAALGAVIMLVGGVLALLTYASPLFASACLIPVLMEFGASRAWLCYIASAVLICLLSPDKELAFFYVFLGYYPIIRPCFLRIPGRVLRAAVKLAYFAAVTALLYVFLYYVLKLEAVTQELGSAGVWMNVLFFAGMTFCLLIYDLVVGYAERFYTLKLRPKLRFLGK